MPGYYLPVIDVASLAPLAQPAFRVLCLTGLGDRRLRDSTERPVTMTEGTNQLVGRDPARIVRTGREVLAAPPLRPGKPTWGAGRLVGV